MDKGLKFGHGFLAILHLLAVYSPQNKNRNEHEDRKGESKGHKPKTSYRKEHSVMSAKKSFDF